MRPGNQTRETDSIGVLQIGINGRDYDAGLNAARAGKWQVVIQRMTAAIAGNPKENDKARTYGAIFIFWLSEFGKAGWAGQQITGCGARRSFDLVGGAIVFVSFAWFAVNLLLLLASLDPRIRPWPFQVALHLLVFL